MTRAVATLVALLVLFAGLALGCGKYGPPVRVVKKSQPAKVEVTDPAAAAQPAEEPAEEPEEEEGSDPEEAQP